MNQGRKRGQVRHTNPLDIGCRGCRRNLRSLIRPNFFPAATHLSHLSALPVHCLAASTFLMAHDHTRHTGHNRSGGGKQQKDRNDTGETTHDSVQYTSGLH